MGPRFVPSNAAFLSYSPRRFFLTRKSIHHEPEDLGEIPARFTKRPTRGLSFHTRSKSRTGKTRGRHEPIDNSRDSSRSLGAPRTRRGNQLYHRRFAIRPDAGRDHRTRHLRALRASIRRLAGERTAARFPRGQNHPRRRRGAHGRGSRAALLARRDGAMRSAAGYQGHTVSTQRMARAMRDSRGRHAQLW
jgi:hypothetical protein